MIPVVMNHPVTVPRKPFAGLRVARGSVPAGKYYMPLQSVTATTFTPSGEGEKGSMDELCRYAERPYAFIARYLRRRASTHIAIVGFVLIAVACAVATQYGVKLLVDTLVPQAPAREVWLAFGFLACLIAIDNLSWRVARRVAHGHFVAGGRGPGAGLFRPPGRPAP